MALVSSFSGSVVIADGVRLWLLGGSYEVMPQIVWMNWRCARASPFASQRASPLQMACIASYPRSDIHRMRRKGSKKSVSGASARSLQGSEAAVELNAAGQHRLR